MYDEGLEVSQDLSVASELDAKAGASGGRGGRERQLKNDQYDEAVDVSMSVAGSSPSKTPQRSSPSEGKEGSPNGGKTTSISNRPFDEAFEVSHSGSEESFDSNGSEKKKPTPNRQQAASAKSPMPQPTQQKTRLTPKDRKIASDDDDDDDEEEEEESDEDGNDGADESYENLEGCYNPKDYANLNVTADVKDLFQYIDRYKPQEVELDTVLKCFIPEYIPAVGEIDSFVKIPKPDGQADDLGLRYLDEPSAAQSDPTVLELQLRAKSKKQQYGDVAVRSIENASKNPAMIEKWIQSIQDLHRSKPPQQVHYKRNMPDPDALMEVWPEDFELALKELALPSPDLDLSIGEYAKVLCSILDIPTYENPIESLHVMFSLYLDFKNNAHFQAVNDANADAKGGANDQWGGDDVLMMDDK